MFLSSKGYGSFNGVATVTLKKDDGLLLAVGNGATSSPPRQQEVSGQVRRTGVKRLNACAFLHYIGIYDRPKLFI